MRSMRGLKGVSMRVTGLRHQVPKVPRTVDGFLLGSCRSTFLIANETVETSTCLVRQFRRLRQFRQFKPNWAWSSPLEELTLLNRVTSSTSDLDELGWNFIAWSFGMTGNDFDELG